LCDGNIGIRGSPLELYLAPACSVGRPNGALLCRKSSADRTHTPSLSLRVFRGSVSAVFHYSPRILPRVLLVELSHGVLRTSSSRHQWSQFDEVRCGKNRPKNNLGAVLIFPQEKWDCPLRLRGSYFSADPKFFNSRIHNPPPGQPILPLVPPLQIR
jgi:hypothetical protein